ncbi:nitroreductase family protein, partial [Staphylococcus hominis]|nr:nitroreductase family protein [Staphylococcus hominis]
MELFDKENTKPFLTEIENRRTIYKTKTSISISDEELEEMIEHIVKYMPSAFNSQSTRIVLLLNDQHIKFWENAKTVLKDVMGPDRDFEPTDQRINGFEHAYGT